jgi:hypothetical protein
MRLMECDWWDAVDGQLEVHGMHELQWASDSWTTNQQTPLQPKIEKNTQTTQRITQVGFELYTNLFLVQLSLTQL